MTFVGLTLSATKSLVVSYILYGFISFALIPYESPSPKVQIQLSIGFVVGFVVAVVVVVVVVVFVVFVFCCICFLLSGR